MDGQPQATYLEPWTISAKNLENTGIGPLRISSTFITLLRRATLPALPTLRWCELFFYQLWKKFEERMKKKIV